MGLVALVLGVAGVALSAGAIAACLRLASPASFVLAWFVLGWGLVVALTLALSVLGAWTVGWMLATLWLAAAASVAVWHRAGRPALPPVGPTVRSVAAELHDPPLALLAIAVALGWAYLAVVGIVIPPMDWDVLMYHLPRIVLWMQQDGVGAIPNAGTSIVAHPPGAETAQGTTMLLSGSDRWVWLLQWLAGGASALAVAGIARRIGVERRGALFAALVFMTFPIVAVQAATAYNDVAVAAALVAAAYFALGRTNAELALAGASVALALATKISGVLGLPALALFVLVAAPRERLPKIALAGVAGCAAGCGWYLWNLARTGSWDGGLADEFDQTPSRAPLDVLLRAERYAVDSLDLSGIVGRDRWLFPLAAVALATAAVVLVRRGRAGLGFVAAAIAVAVTPWAIDAAHDVTVRAFARGWIAIGKGDVIGFLPDTVRVRASPPEAWFGPVLVPLALAAVLVALRRGGRRAPSRAIVLTACLGVPLVLLATNSLAFAWQDQRGRFFVLGAAIAAAGLGILASSAAVRWAGATVATLTLGLTIVHFTQRPLGLELLEPRTEPTLWTAPRWEAQSAFSRDAPEVGEALRRIEEDVPLDTTIALARVVQAPYYPLLGHGPWRRAVFVPQDGHVPAEASYVALPVGAHVDLDGSEWQLLPGTGTGSAWTVYRRVG